MNQAVKKKAVKVLYIGGDLGFWQTIQSRFLRQYDTVDWEFKTWNIKNEVESLRLFIEILEYDPEYIYVDLSENKKLYYPIGQLLGRDNFFHSKPVMGLIDKKEKISEFLALSLDFIFVKGVETFDFVHHPISLTRPKTIKKLDFALAKFNKQVDLKDDLRIGFITPTMIHMEGSLPMTPGEKSIIKTELPLKNVQSKSFTLKNISQSNLYYPYEYAYDFDIDFVDPPEFGEDEQDDALGEEDEKKKLKLIKEAKEKRREKINEAEQMLLVCKKRHKDWVLHNLDPASEKSTKVLFVDRWMRIFKDPNIKSLDQYGFGMRTQTFLSDGFEDIDQIRPNIIAIQLVSQVHPDKQHLFDCVLKERSASNNENSGPPEYPDFTPDENTYLEFLRENIEVWEKAEIEKVGSLIKRIKELGTYSPVIVLFNSYFQNSNAFQESFAYPLIMTHKKEITLDTITGMADIFKERQKVKTEEAIKEKVEKLKKEDPKKHRKLTVDDFLEKKLFINKNSPLSFAEIKLPITMKTLNESIVTFSTPLSLPAGTFRTNFPVEMSIRLVDIEDGKFCTQEAGEFLYKGLIHSITEEEKKSIRRYINEVFFEPLMEKKEKESSDYWNKHQKALEQKEEEAIKKEEEAKSELGTDEQGENTSDEQEENASDDQSDDKKEA